MQYDQQLRKCLKNIVSDLEILSGNVVGPSDVSWQDVAGTLATNLRVAAANVENMREGRQSFPVFWPMSEIMEEMQGA